jgi:branched-chain amino acid transport system substrate-binding protein
VAVCTLFLFFLTKKSGKMTVKFSTCSGRFLVWRALLSTVLSLILLLNWCSALSSFADPLRIGEINPLTGRLAKHGLEIHQGVEAAIAEVNEAGGLNGVQIELISRDDQSRPDVAISRAEELCTRQKVLALTGGYVDSLVGPISEVARKHQVPYLASASLQKELVERHNPYFFRVARLQGFVEPLCGFLVEHLRPQRLAVLHAATPGATEFARDLEVCLQSKGIGVDLLEKFRPGMPDFTPLIGKLASMNIDVVVSGGFFPDHLLLVRQLKENKVSPKAYIGPFGIAYQSFIEEMGEDAEYLFSTCAWNPTFTLPGTELDSQRFVDRFTRMFKRTPNTTNMHGYTSTRALLAAVQLVLEQNKPVTGQNIRQALAGLDLLLPMERLSFDERGDPNHYHHLVIQIQDGKLVPVYPSKRATGSAIYPMPSWSERN